jgi:hypothetical protein
VGQVVRLLLELQITIILIMTMIRIILKVIIIKEVRVAEHISNFCLVLAVHGDYRVPVCGRPCE